jgi:hypothetical protein
MEFLIHRRLAIPLSAIAFFTVVLTAPAPATLWLMPAASVFIVAALGITAIVCLTPDAIPLLRASGSLVRIRPSGHRGQARPRIIMAGGICMRTLEQPNRSAADDVLDLVRMDDEGGWQMARPPA